MKARIAATNLQLYRELQAAKWPHEDICALHDAYKLAAQLSHSSFRPSWKPFLAHLVGVASIVAWDTRDVNVVIAAMLHSALQFGRFPPLIRLFNTKESYLRSRVGMKALEIVKAYHTAPWQEILEPSYSASEDQYSILKIKLADTLDDLVDEFSTVATLKILPVALEDGAGIRNLSEMAGRLAAPVLASAYKQLLCETQPRKAIHERLRATFALRAFA